MMNSAAVRGLCRLGPAVSSIGWIVVSILSLLVASSPAQFEAGVLQPLVTGGLIPGNGDNDDVDIGELRLGLGHYFRDNIGFYTELSAYRPDGTRDGRSVNTTALGLAFAVRWHCLRWSRFSLYGDWGMGVMAGLDAFPPGGTNVNGTSHFGLGLSARLKHDLHLLAGLRQLHMSNGKGLGPDNPSFDGLGAYLGVALLPGTKPPFPPLGETVPYGGGNLRVRADATLEHSDDDDSPGGTVAVDFLLVPSADVHGQLAYSAAELVDKLIWEAAVHLYRQTQSHRLALGYARKEFDVFTSDFFRAQFEHGLNDVAVVRILTAYERKNLADDRVFGSVFVTVFPVNALALRSGVGFERQEHEFFGALKNLNDAGFNFGVEWSPAPLAGLGLSAFVQGGIGYDDQIVGLRFHSGGKRSLRERYHQSGFVPLR